MPAVLDPDPGDLVLAAGGDAAALGRLLGRWKQRVYGVFERWEEPSAAAETTVQLFAEALERSNSYDPSVPFGEWLFAAAFRRFREAHPGEPVPVARLRESNAARTAFLRSAVAALPPRGRALFLFTRVARLPLPAAGAATGVTPDESRTLLVAAMEELSRKLAPLLELMPEATSPVGAPRPGEKP